MTLALTAAVGGLFLVGTIWLLRGGSLVPLRDPRLDESLQFENTFRCYPPCQRGR